MPSVSANGITIEYEQQGHGDPLLMIMGLGAQLIDWPQGLVDTFATAGFRVVRFDNRDSGLSTEFDWEPPSRRQNIRMQILGRSPEVGYDLSDMADDAAALLDELGIPAAHVVGASMGGMVAQLLAAHHPDRVLTLTSIMSNTGDRRHGIISPRVLPKFLRHSPTRETAALEGTELFSSFAGPSWDFDVHLERARAAVERSYRPKGLLRQLAAIAATGDRTEALQTIDVPTLVIHGMVDSLVTPSGGMATAKAIEGSQLLMFPDMGHDLPASRWEDIVTAVRTLADRAHHPDLSPLVSA